MIDEKRAPEKESAHYENEIVRKINELSGSRSPYEVFCDWIKCLALAISNTSDLLREGYIWQKREEEYVKTIRPYGSDSIKLVEMKDLLVAALEENITDVLGKVYMDSGCGNKNTGQFFTPFHLSLLTVQCTLPKDISPSNPLILNEPSCGSGGMIIAIVKVLKDRGINPQRSMEVVAQDLDWKAVYMAYIQLSLLGIKATVAQGNTLAEPYKKGYSPERVLYTPARKGLII